MMREIDYLFWLRKNQLNSKGEAKIYCRIFSPKKRINFSTGESVAPIQWQNELKRVTRENIRYKIINERLDRIEQRIRRTIYKFEDEDKIITPEGIKEELDGRSNRDKLLFDVFKYYITQHKTRSTHRTLKNYSYTKQRIEQFIISRKSISNIYLPEVNLAFITEFENFLCNDQGLKPISANKHTQRRIPTVLGVEEI